MHPVIDKSAVHAQRVGIKNLKESKILQILLNKLFYILVFSISVIIYAQPANDECINAIDISDGAWYIGDNTNSTLNCTDHRSSNCAAKGSNAVANNTVNMCCGISGVEGTVWFKFIALKTDLINLEIKDQVCNPVSFFGLISTIQGFIIRKPSNCASSNPDTTKACFDPSSTANFTTSFSAIAGVEYYVQIDTKKNTLTTCNCGASSATCHSNCTFELRITYPNTTTPLGYFNINELENDINELQWKNIGEQKYRKISIVKSTKNSKTILSEMYSNSYRQHWGLYTFTDSSEKSSNYFYEIYGENPKSSKTLLVKSKEYFSNLNTQPYISQNSNNEPYFIHNLKNDESYSLVLIDKLGRKITEKIITNNNPSIDLNTETSGLYFIILNSTENSYFYKILKN